MKHNRLTIVIAQLATLLLVTSAAVAAADEAPRRFEAIATDAQEVRGNGTAEQPFVAADFDSPGEAHATFRFDRGLTQVRVRVTLRHLADTFTRAHLHCARAGENGPIALGFIAPGPLERNGKLIHGTLTNADLHVNQNPDAQAPSCQDSIGRPINTMAALASAMRDGLIYLNIHTTEQPAGEVRGQVYEDEVD